MLDFVMCKTKVSRCKRYQTKGLFRKNDLLNYNQPAAKFS